MGAGGSMSDEQFEELRQLIKAKKCSCGGSGCVTVLFVLFLLGLFKGCGY